MAQKITVTIVDDLDGSTADETVSFGVDGVNYEIDLNHQNAAELRAALATYAGAARRTSGRAARIGSSRPPSAATVPSRTREETKAIRAWARENGHTVSDRGRIAENVVQAYTDRGNQPTATPVDQPTAAEAPETNGAASKATANPAPASTVPETVTLRTRRKTPTKATSTPGSATPTEGDTKSATRVRKPRAAAPAGKMAKK